MSHYLIEKDCELIRDHIQSGIVAALQAESILYGDNSVKLPEPQTYFLYHPASSYKTPGVFIVGDSIDFRIHEKGANYIDANCRINVTVIVEDKTLQLLTIGTYRYQAALHKLLAQTRLESADKRVTIIIKVVRAAFSPVYTNAQEQGNPAGVFRKEILLECEVDHHESLTA